ncbi:MAG: TonB-dependent receptor [Acidobacteria bacterium]|nr:TonB-dependent receptor [Acidobacteriota bacterium]
MKFPEKFLLWMALTLLALTFGPGLLAQSDRGSITGTVVDPSGAAIPAAKVEATQTATNFSRQVESTATGNYVIPELPAGAYTLTVSTAGFKSYTRTGITVAVSQTARVDITLEVGTVTQSVEVRADATLLRTEDAEISTSINNDYITSLPLDFSNAIRNPMSFIKIVPGSNINLDSSWPVTSQNGLQSFTEELRVDGATSTNPTPGVFNEVQPSVDAIQEFSVQTSNFNAEYGQAGGAIFNFTLKSGTNDLHGTVYEYLRNEALNACNHDLECIDASGDRHPSKQRRHDFGGTVGGPFVIPRLYNGRDKTFWFTSFEDFYSRDPRQGFWSVPRNEWRDGDLSSLLLPNILGTDALGRSIREGQIYDPATTREVFAGQVDPVTGLVATRDATVRDPFTDNQVPLRSSVAQEVLGFIPQASNSGLDRNNLLGPTGTPLRDSRIWSLKVDHHFSPKSHLSSSFNYMWTHKINGDDPFGAASAARDQTITSKTFRLNHDYIFSPTMINHFTFGVLRYQNPDGVPDRGFDPEAELGLSGTLITGWFPRFQYGLSDIGTNQLKHLYHTVPTVTDSVSKVIGSHTFKFGAEYRKALANFFGGNGAYGNLTFRREQSALPEAAAEGFYGQLGSEFASFLLGEVGVAGMNSPVNMAYRSSDYAFYAQDEWKVTPRLTVNYGLRYDLHKPLTEKYGRISSFVADLPNPAAGNTPGGLGFLGDCEACVGRNSWLDTDWKDFGPRIGAAYRVSNKTVFRGGFGVVYGRLEVNTFDPIQSVGSGSVTTSYPSIDQVTQSLFNMDDGFPAVNAVPPVFDPTLLNNQGINVFSRESGRLPRIYNWNFTIQQEITSNLLIEAAYVGNHGTRLIAGFLKDLNQNDFSVLSMGNTLLEQVNSEADAQALGVPYPYPGFTGTVAQALRPYPQYRSILDPQATVGESDYNALQLTVRQRPSRGLDFLLSYTLSKNITTVDDAFGWGGFGIIGAVNAKNLSLERGLAVDTTFTNSRGDRTHNMALSFGYDLPFAKSAQSAVVRKLAGGWRVAGIFQYASGAALPLSPYWPNNLANVIFNNEGRYDRVAGVPIRNNVSDAWPGVSFMFNPDAFADPQDFTPGNAARTYGNLRGFPFLNEDLSITKQVRFTENKRLEIRMDAFNLLNRSIFNNPSTAVYDTPRTQGGRAVGYGTFWGRMNIERQMQISLRLVF